MHEAGSGSDGWPQGPDAEDALGRVINERIAAHQTLARGEKMTVFCECEDRTATSAPN